MKTQFLILFNQMVQPLVSCYFSFLLPNSLYYFFYTDKKSNILNKRGGGLSFRKQSKLSSTVFYTNKKLFSTDTHQGHETKVTSP